MLKGDERLLSYPWSSFGAYLAAPEHRPGWIRADRLLGEHGIQADTSVGREQFERRRGCGGKRRCRSRRLRRGCIWEAPSRRMPTCTNTCGGVKRPAPTKAASASKGMRPNEKTDQTMADHVCVNAQLDDCGQRLDRPEMLDWLFPACIGLGNLLRYRADVDGYEGHILEAAGTTGS